LSEFSLKNAALQGHLKTYSSAFNVELRGTPGNFKIKEVVLTTKEED
jgi:hypothetical protein